MSHVLVAAGNSLYLQLDPGTGRVITVATSTELAALNIPGEVIAAAAEHGANTHRHLYNWHAPTVPVAGVTLDRTQLPALAAAYHRGDLALVKKIACTSSRPRGDADAA